MAEQEKDERIREAARFYYRRRDVQKALAGFSANREVVPRYVDSFGRRPDTLQYESDAAALAEKGATSFHCSEELWRDPLQLSTEMTEEQVKQLRIGWDLLIDIDTPYLDYGRITAELIIEALKFHNVHSFGIKYSGSRGFHIGVPYKAFPEKIGEIETRNFFPDGARAITQYLFEMIKSKAIERINEIKGGPERNEELIKKIIEDTDSTDSVIPGFGSTSLIASRKKQEKRKEETIPDLDLVLVSPRHLFRMPYSLHEKTGLSSIVIKPEQLKNFKPSWAKPELVMIKPFLPEPEKNEARELLIQAMDWHARQKEAEKAKTEVNKGVYSEFVIKDLTPNLYPPCLTNILAGVKQDGRKRALFVLLNFFKSLKLNENDIEKRIEEWNKKNYKPLRESYVRTQISWFKRQKAILPPNCDKTLYKEIGVCMPDGMCKLVKNPVNYTIRKSRLLNQQEKPKQRRKLKDKK